MAEKVTKTVEIELTTNQDKLKSGVADANKTLSDLKSTQAKGNKQTDRDQVKRDREEKFKQRSQKQSDKAQSQARRRELQIIQKISKAEKTKTAELRKQTTLLERQARVLNKAQRAGGGGVGGGRGAGGAGMGEGGATSALKKTGFLGKLAIVVGGAVAGVFASQIRAGYQTFVEAERAQAPLAAATLDREGFKVAAAEGYDKYGYVRAETARQALDMARETGNVRDTSFAQMVSRSGAGVGQGGATDMMGMLTRAGVKGFDKADAKGRREFENIIARGMTAGLDKSEAIGSMPEFVSGVERLIQRQGAVSAGTVTSMNVAKLLSFFGQSKQAGFQRSRGAEVLSKVDAAIRKPGGGAEGEAFMMRAFGFGTPGGTAGFMEARGRMQQGVTNPQNLVDMVTQAQREFGRGEASTFALEKVTGLSISQIETLKERVGALRAGGDPEAIGKDIKKFAEQAQSMDDRLETANRAGFAETVIKLGVLTQHLDILGEKVFEPIHAVQVKINEGVMATVVGVEKTVNQLKKIYRDGVGVGTQFAGPRGGEAGGTVGRGTGALPAPGQGRFTSDDPLMRELDKAEQEGRDPKQVLKKMIKKPHIVVTPPATFTPPQGIEPLPAPITSSVESMAASADRAATAAEHTAAHARSAATTGNAALQSGGTPTNDIDYTPGTPQ